MIRFGGIPQTLPPAVFGRLRGRRPGGRLRAHEAPDGLLAEGPRRDGRLSRHFTSRHLSDGNRLISVSVSWRSASVARKQGVAEAVARPFLGRLNYHAVG
jgi:hypothetical protein